ncbi:MAG: hypothetical protein ACJA1Z_002059 [Patiriisocius sp.]|jgi:hypothetical protein
MLNDLKSRIKSLVSNISEEAAHFILEANANRLGAMTHHLAAV